MDNQTVDIIGAGLAGSEATYQLAKRGINVRLFEMRDKKMTPAHHTDQFAELVCTNSMRSNEITNGVGLLKAEMRELDSIIMKSADANQVPAGSALAVDRDSFSQEITQKIREMPNVEIINEEVDKFSSNPTIIATGPLTSASLTSKIKELTGQDELYFYDAAAPIISSEKIDRSIVYEKSRYDKGEAAYLNCPMNKDQFMTFYEALISAEKAELHDFEDSKYFEGCMPVEEMASRGEKTLLFGPLKPVGLEMPNGEMPYAVVQLRQDNVSKTMYNLVGFQTQLKWGEQKRVFQLIPGLEDVEFIRYGVMHRNTFLNSPKLLSANYQLKDKPQFYFAGQITGVEGYVESAGSGLFAALSLFKQLKGESLIADPHTMIGAMGNYVANADAKYFQPMNANFGIMTPLTQRIRNKKERREIMAQRALELVKNWKV
ncbi:methylenetetrahydrofolate--tRNA-(uracil(54)-C(5))-methyltransferase (FADH(2)-oxidizing) TrmFO [Xylocopilactobacillus apicola]|uniref:Methylenetetrahydrofolate--tRNA-(uracil-5-)-methyltransferase TrmFO n=1 Tax=Xylocopilactobacillus apicola TaxID=2932184 RepID=A0AAU9DTE0_9LACO|nr:methylenetetrahydrofolate--tRNA-(uracil(54)-C(5))-methyltransferase (FADH(2)-oxidizing) TrmFO [Xylocopilactobacillus apicola]BDR58643.1 methylenetetrahydrofolate--tRNA-(uracil-5-)-methyltransferase TrmFO [Xylocopilactobacillus apicola]